MQLPSTFAVGLTGISVTGTSEAPLVWFNNLSTSKVQALMNQRKLASLAAAVNAILKFYLNPTVTGNGTVYTPANLGAGFGVSSAILAYTNPTVSANGLYLFGLASINFAEVSSDVQVCLQPGNTLLVTATLSTSASPILFDQFWDEYHF